MKTNYELALQWCLDNGDDSGYPIKQAAERWDLTDEEYDNLYEACGRDDRDWIDEMSWLYED
jgi:hypothetical protein